MKNLTTIILITCCFGLRAMNPEKAESLLQVLELSYPNNPSTLLFASEKNGNIRATHQIAITGTAEQLEKLCRLAQRASQDPRLPAYLRVPHYPAYYVSIRDNEGNLPIDFAAYNANAETCLYLYQSFHHKHYGSFKEYYPFIKVYKIVVEEGYDDLLQQLFNVGHPFFLLNDDDGNPIFHYTRISRDHTQNRICNICTRPCNDPKTRSHMHLTWNSFTEKPCSAHIYLCGRTCLTQVTLNVKRSS